MTPNKRVNNAFSLLFQGQIEKADELSKNLLLDPLPDAPSYFLAAEISLAKNKLTDALEYISLATDKQPPESQFQLRKAEIQLMLRHGIEAQETAAYAANSHADNPAVQLGAAVICRQCDNHKEAERFLLNIEALDFKSQRFLMEFARNQFYLGKMAKADQIIEHYLSLYPQNDGTIHLLRAQLEKQTTLKNHIAQLRKQVHKAKSAKEKVNLHFALAKELEDIEDFTGSFEELSAGTKLQRRQLNYSLQDEIANINSLIDTFQVDKYAKIAHSNLSDKPIFIVGMPRTGTTLVERILSNYSGVISAGETNDFTIAMSQIINQYMQDHSSEKLSSLDAAMRVDYTKIGQKYTTNLVNMMGKAQQTVDKLPFNFLYCGLIKKAFPQARIIHLVRDPIDTCYAVFKTLFNQSYFFSYDLDELADYYIAYRKLMEHWHTLMPSDILDVEYEKLVQEPEASAKRIVDFCGLEWSKDSINIENIQLPSSTASAAQIRQPIYTSSVNKWRNYELQLSQLINKLKAADMLS